ncbi:MAG: leucine-rich repeat protein [Clostridia bacterium]|nr:leucine-rich repeat protein [Clostridia bacterium]
MKQIFMGFITICSLAWLYLGGAMAEAQTGQAIIIHYTGDPNQLAILEQVSELAGDSAVIVVIIPGSASIDDNDDSADTSMPVATESLFFISGDFGCILIDGQITILNYIGNETEVMIPDQIEGHPVTAIGDRAFFNRPELQSITIPSSVSVIGEQVFDGCGDLIVLVTEGSYAAFYAREKAIPYSFGSFGFDQPETPSFVEAKIRTASGGNLNLRSTPSSRPKDNIVVSMPSGATVWIESYSGAWAKVFYTDRRGTQYEGYAYAKHLRLQ